MQRERFSLGINAQLIGQDRPAARKRLQRLGRIAGAVVGFHDQPPGAFPAGVLCQGLAGVGQRLIAAAQRQQAGRQRLLHAQERLAQPLPLRDGPLLVGVVEQVVAPVERFGRAVSLDRGRPLALRLTPVPGPDVCQEADPRRSRSLGPGRSDSRGAGSG